MLDSIPLASSADIEDASPARTRIAIDAGQRIRLPPGAWLPLGR
jgi:hypothetical protein